MKHITRMHISEINIRCPICTRKFKTIENWQEHMKNGHPPNTEFTTMSQAFNGKIVEKEFIFGENMFEDAFGPKIQAMITEELKYFRIYFGAIRYSVSYSVLMQRDLQGLDSMAEDQEIFFFKVR